MARYWGSVVSQNADKSLEVTLDDPRWPGLSAVPIVGPPGMVFTVAAGARVLIGFAAGDASKPIAEFWGTSTLTALTVSGTTISISASGQANVTGSPLILNSGSTPVAKEGSALTGTAGPYALSGSVATGAGSANVRVP
jgi:hypothetical protein